jgi:hypothetical protein
MQPVFGGVAAAVIFTTFGIQIFYIFWPLKDALLGRYLRSVEEVKKAGAGTNWPLILSNLCLCGTLKQGSV